MATRYSDDPDKRNKRRRPGFNSPTLREPVRKAIATMKTKGEIVGRGTEFGFMSEIVDRKPARPIHIRRFEKDHRSRAGAIRKQRAEALVAEVRNSSSVVITRERGEAGDPGRSGAGPRAMERVRPRRSAAAPARPAEPRPQ